MSKDNEPITAPRGAEDDHHGSGNTGSEITLIVFTAVLLLLNVTGLFTQIFGLDTALIVTLVGGYGLIWDSLAKLARGRLGGDLAVTIAAVAALCIGQFAAAAEVILIMLIGKALETYAVGRTRNAVAALRKLVPQTVTVLRGEHEVAVPPEGVLVGDRVRVRPGERIPVDGVVRRGHSAVDEAALTGEALPQARTEGETVHAGTLNVSGLLEIEATAVGANTTLAQIARQVAEAESRKAPTQRLADRAGRPFVLLVLCAGALTFLLWYFPLHAPLDVALTRMASALIIACPCALVLATPTGIAAAIGRLARRGVLAQGGAGIEALAQVDCVVFDKTGTLTRGRPEVVEIVTLDGRTEEEALRLAAMAEQSSRHPLARCVLLTAEARGIRDFPALDRAEERPGLGVVAYLRGRCILAGSRRLLAEQGVMLSTEAETQATALEARGQTVLYVTEEGAPVGLIAIADPVRPEAAAAIAALQALGIAPIEMLTGDAVPVAAAVANAVGIGGYQAGLFPADKRARIEALQAQGRRVAFVGDGINDAPALAAANVGIAMGHDGADIAVEAAGLVLVADDLTRLPEALMVSRRALRLIQRNLLLYGIGWNAVSVLVSAAGGLAWFGSLLQARWPALFGTGRDLSPILAAILHQAASLLVIGSALRLLTARVAPKADAPGAVLSGACVLARVRQRLMANTAVEFLAAVGEACTETLRAHPTRARALVCCFLLGLWLSTGFYTIPMGQVGVLQRFGKLMAAQVPAGMHYRLPWPIESVTTVDLASVHRAEIGFRTLRPSAAASASSEWNSTHGDSIERVAEEALLITGDAYLADANLTLQYRVQAPRAYLFHVADAEILLRQSGEAALRRVAERTSLEAMLTTGRRALEAEILRRTQEDCDRFETGLVVVEARLQEVHPPQEVVAAYRDVSSAAEEKVTAVAQAEAYRNETIPLAQGQAVQNVALAAGYTFERTHHASGDSDRFLQMWGGFRQGAEVNAERLFLETVEVALERPGKYVLDPQGGGRRQLWLSDGPLYNLPALPAPEPAPSFPPPVEQ